MATEKNNVQPGTYRVRAIFNKADDLQFGWSGNAENGRERSRQVGLQVVIVDGEFKNRTLPFYGNLKEGTEAVRITLDALEALGATWNSDEITDITPGSLGSVEASAVVTHEPVQKYVNGQLVTETEDDGTGKQVPKIIPQIKYINALGGVRMKEVLDSDAKDEMNLSFAGTISERRKKKGGGSNIPLDPATGKPMF